jgi:hypothetical protein
MTNEAMLVAIVVGLKPSVRGLSYCEIRQKTECLPSVVGWSVDPKAEIMSLIPAAAYWDLMELLWEEDIETHSWTSSAGPEARRKDKILRGPRYF